MITFRIARVEDAPRILEIYAYYVENTAVSYEYDVPTLAEFTERIRSTLVKYPYIVAEEDGRIVGYIYASRFAQRAAYGWAAGTSIYIDRDYHRRGIGKLLYEKLEAILKLQNITNLYAGAADPMEEEDPYLTRNSPLQRLRQQIRPLVQPSLDGENHQRAQRSAEGSGCIFRASGKCGAGDS